VDDIRWWIPLLAAAGATAGLWGLGRRASSVWGRAAFFAWLYFCVMLAPVLGFTDVGFMLYSLLADHYQHLALIAVTTLAAAGLVSWVGRLPPFASQAGWALCALLAGLLGALTMRQSSMYRDPQTLYTTTIERNPACWLAQNNLANDLASIPVRMPEALTHYEEAQRIDPGFAEAQHNIGLLCAKMGRFDEAIAHWEMALKLDPTLTDARDNLNELRAMRR